MDLLSTMLKNLRIAQRIVREGSEVIPAWRIGTPRTDWVILTRLNHDQPGEQERILHLVGRFMVSTRAETYLLTGETGLGPTALIRKGEESIVCAVVSGSDRFLMRQRIYRKPSLEFGGLECVERKQLDRAYWTLLDGPREAVGADELEALNAVFGFNGEFPAQWV